jgi:outer membrane biosynthesis protein TonB
VYDTRDPEITTDLRFRRKSAHDTEKMRPSLRSLWSVLLVVTLASAGAGCAQKTHAQTRAEPPATLDVPQPPPRVVVPPQPEAPEVVEETQPPSPARPRPARPAQRPEAKPDPARQDAASEPAPVLEPPPTPETKPAHPADAAGVAAVRQQMSRASQNLGHVNYAGLSNDMKAQYDTANRFLALADQALKEGNLLFASTLVDKAGAIASLITGQ